MFISLSVLLVLVSLTSLFLFGLNLGIDFKGGMKLVLSFESTEVERSRIKATIENYVLAKSNVAGTQVEVQDFDTGVTLGEETTKRRFVVYM